MSQPKTLIITGGTGEFFAHTKECIASIVAAGLLKRADLAVLDQGLSQEQIDIAKPHAKHLMRLQWSDIGARVPEKHQLDKHLSLPGRPILPKLFPGYDVYLWMDGDAWVQTPEFFDVYVKGAMDTGLAVAKENGTGYNPTLIERRWWIGNYFLGFGIVGGIRGGLLVSPINNGVFAMHRDAPHWQRYRDRHQAAMDRTGKINLDQHALHATAVLDGMPVTYVSARHNWLPILSRPVWDRENKLMCEPAPEGEPLSVIHLAGPGKFDMREVTVRQGGTISTAMTFEAVAKLRTQGRGNAVEAPIDDTGRRAEPRGHSPGLRSIGL